MAHTNAKLAGLTGILAFLLLSEPANALRCGTKLVREGMVESEVIRLCGSPVSTRHLGYVLRSYYRFPHGVPVVTRIPQRHGFGYYQELEVTEMLFNFGPRRLMRWMRFEGGRLAKVETAGYGYLETD